MSSITTDDGITIRYDEQGSGPLLVLLHGLGGCSEDWGPQLDHFADRYHVVAPNVRGHGNSDRPPGPYSVPGFARDVAAVIRGIDAAPAHIVGLSMGGMVAFQLALDYPDLIRSLVIVNSGPRSVPKGPKGWLFLQLRRVMARRLTPAQMAEKLVPRLFPDPEHAEVAEAFRRRFARNDQATYRECIEALVGWAVEDRIGGITTPTLFISSDQDYTPPSLKESFARLMPNARLEVIADAHHAVTVERPEAFNEMLDRFLTHVEGAEREQAAS